MRPLVNLNKCLNSYNYYLNLYYSSNKFNKSYRYENSSSYRACWEGLASNILNQKTISFVLKQDQLGVSYQIVRGQNINSYKNEFNKILKQVLEITNFNLDVEVDIKETKTQNKFITFCVLQNYPLSISTLNSVVVIMGKYSNSADINLINYLYQHLIMFDQNAKNYVKNITELQTIWDYYKKESEKIINDSNHDSNEVIFRITKNKSMTFKSALLFLIILRLIFLSKYHNKSDILNCKDRKSLFSTLFLRGTDHLSNHIFNIRFDYEHTKRFIDIKKFNKVCNPEYDLNNLKDNLINLFLSDIKNSSIDKFSYDQIIDISHGYLKNRPIIISLTTFLKILNEHV